MQQNGITRTDYILSRILAKLGLLRQNEPPKTAQRFLYPYSDSAGGSYYKGTIFTAGNTAGKFVDANSHRFAILMSQQSGGSCRVWINGSMGANGGLVVPSTGYLYFNRIEHGALASAELWVINPLGATSFSFLEVF